MQQQVHFEENSAVARLVRVFNNTFASYATVLEGGGEEPVYHPAGTTGGIARIIFTRDYFASALHEVAHWCVAGPERRRQPDYGYWYVPDGRNKSQQRAFEQVEVKPQALEWIFSVASLHRFRISADNLDGSAGASDDFKKAVWLQALHYCRVGLPGRAGRFANALRDEFTGSDHSPLSTRHFNLHLL